MAARAALVAALATAAVVVGVAPAHAYVYWINRNTDGTQSIARVQNDGAGFSYRLIEGVRAEQTQQGGITGQVAVNDRFIYWTNTQLNTIGRANLDGTSVDQSFITVGTAGPYDGPDGVAATPDHVFYSSGNVIYRADPDGRNAVAFYQDAGASAVDALGVGPSTLYWSRQNGETGLGIGAIGFDGSDPNVVVDTVFTDGVTGDAGDVFSAIASGAYPVRRAGLDRTDPATFVAGDTKRKTGLAADRCLLAYAEVNANSSGGVANAGDIAVAPLTTGTPQTLISGNVLDPQGAALDELGAGGSPACTTVSDDGGTAPPTTTTTTPMPTTPTDPTPTTPTPTLQLPTSVPQGGFTREQVQTLLGLALDYFNAHITDPNRLLDARYKVAEAIIQISDSDTAWCGIGGCDGNDPYAPGDSRAGTTLAGVAAVAERATGRITYAERTTTPAAGIKRPSFATVRAALTTLVTADRALTKATRKVAALVRAHAKKPALAKARKAVKAAKAKLATVPLATIKLTSSAAGKAGLRALAAKAKKGKPARFLVRLSLRDPISGATASHTSIVKLSRHGK